ncbi:MAG: alpha-isopropylmalate synthase regulatory domain-containing protein [Acidimicrobiia bacterium]
MTVEQVAEQVSQEVTGGDKVSPRPLLKVETRGLTLEFDAEAYPEVGAAFDAYRRVTSVEATLGAYSVRPVEDEGRTRARVTATVQVHGSMYIGHGVDDDVVAGAVRAFAAAVDQNSAAA